MLDKVQHLYVVPISFEEAPYESAVDLKSIPILQSNGTTVTFLTPPMVDFGVTLGPAGSHAYSLAQSVVNSYVDAGLPGIYSVIQSAAGVSVIPQQVRSPSGAMRAVRPVMSSPVRFPLETRGAVETLQLVAQLISSQTGASVIVLNTPFHLTDTLTMGATGETARDLVAQLGSTLGVPMSSQCLYEATDKTYYRNVESIFVPNPAGVPASSVRGFRTPLPASLPTSSPAVPAGAP